MTCDVAIAVGKRGKDLIQDALSILKENDNPKEPDFIYYVDSDDYYIFKWEWTRWNEYAPNVAPIMDVVNELMLSDENDDACHYVCLGDENYEEDRYNFGGQDFDIYVRKDIPVPHNASVLVG